MIAAFRFARSTSFLKTGQISKTTDLRPTNAALADVYTYAVSPEYLHAEHVDQIRSYHPWGLLMDEAAFQPQAGEAPRLHRIGPIVATHQQ